MCQQVTYETMLPVGAEGRRLRRRQQRGHLHRRSPRWSLVGGDRLRADPAARPRADASRWRSRREGAPFVNARWLAGKVAAALLTFAFVLVFNFFLFRVMGDPTAQLARLPRATPQEIEKLKANYGLDKPITGQFVDYAGDTLRLDLGIEPAHAPLGLDRDQGGGALDAAAGRHGHAAGDSDRLLAGGDRRDQARQARRRRPARVQPVHLRRARVLDRNHPDPRLRGLAADPARRASR